MVASLDGEFGVPVGVVYAEQCYKEDKASE
jgi:hypothetical protein